MLGACLVTQPRKLADKKSSFLRALRRESSETNADVTPTSPVSSSPTLTTVNKDKQVPWGLLIYHTETATDVYCYNSLLCVGQAVFLFYFWGQLLVDLYYCSSLKHA